MKNKILALLLILGIFVTGCANNKSNENINSNESEMTENSDKDTVYASFYPIYNLTKQIAGDKFNVKSFVNLNTEVHDFEPSAKEMAQLSDAKALFLNGAQLESWQEDIKKAIDIDMVDTSKDIDLIKVEEDHHEEEHHEHEEDDKKDDHEHEHEENDKEAHHHHGQYDPHIWLSAKNAIIQAKNIAYKLGEIDPENKDFYNENYEKIKKELEEIDKEYQEKFKNKSNKKFLVNHEAFSYLARDYDLEQIALTSITSTNEADAKTMKEAIDFVKENNIEAVFYEKGGSDKNAKTLADELSLDLKPINTIEYASNKELEEGKTLQELIKENLEILESSLK